MLNFPWIVSKLIDQVYLFIKMYGVKGKLSRTYFREMGSFFGFCNTIFCRHHQWTSKKYVHEYIQKLLNFQRNVTKIIDLVYLVIKITGIKGQLSGSSFMELESFFGFCNVFLHPQGDLFSWPLCRLHHQKKSQNLQFFFSKIKYIIV